MPWWLTPLHAPRDPAIELPREGTASIGRRPTNTIVCRALAVSGQHCVIHCGKHGQEDLLEVEDSSTNGTYVNDIKLSKGQRQSLAPSDVLSLTKLPDEDAGLDLSIRVQFRLDFKDSTETPSKTDSTLKRKSSDTRPELLLKRSASGTERERTLATGIGVVADEVPATAPDVPLKGASDVSSFAQDLLVQEQQAKAKITSELLMSQRKLEEERQSVEAASRDLRKIRQQVDEERARRQEAEEVRDRYVGEAEALRSKRWEVGDHRAAYEELRQRSETADAELLSQRSRCAQLEAVTEQLRHDVQRATEARQKASQQHAEIMTRLRQAQERADRLDQQHAEARREVDRASEEGIRLQQELDDERKKREELEQTAKEKKDQVMNAEAIERSAREELDADTTRNAELECKVAAAQTEAEGVRAVLRQLRHKIACSKQTTEHLHEQGMSFAAELRRRADLWEKAITEDCFEGLEEYCKGNTPATFVQVTHRQEETPTKSSPRQAAGAKDEDVVPVGSIDLCSNVEAESLAAPCQSPQQLDGNGGATWRQSPEKQSPLRHEGTNNEIKALKPKHTAETADERAPVIEETPLFIAEGGRATVLDEPTAPEPVAAAGFDGGLATIMALLPEVEKTHEPAAREPAGVNAGCDGGLATVVAVLPEGEQVCNGKAPTTPELIGVAAGLDGGLATIMAVLPEGERLHDLAAPKRAATAIAFDGVSGKQQEGKHTEAIHQQDDGDSLLEAAALDPQGHQAANVGSFAGAMLQGAGCVSTAWSLEVVEVGSFAEEKQAQPQDLLPSTRPDGPAFAEPPEAKRRRQEL